MTFANPFRAQVQLLVDLLPLVDEHRCFALKGGTAINLFIRDMPRLSVDIDLVYLPASSREDAIREVTAALRQITSRVNEVFPGAKVTESYQQRAEALRLVVGRGGAQVQIELSPVLRGTVHEPGRLSVSQAVEDSFGYAEMAVVSLPDLYGGKICAALDRQHPRDWFDVMQLLDAGELDRAVFLGFIAYLLAHPRPLNEVLAPRWKPLAGPYEREFAGMLREPVPLTVLEQTQQRLLTVLGQHLTQADIEFLLSFKQGRPRWDLLPLAKVDELPAVRWKLQNINNMKPAKRAEGLVKLEAVLNRLSGGEFK